jgi:serine O-acetyltransferase
MIKSKQDYVFYLKSDYFSLGKKKPTTLRDKIVDIVFKDKIWEFQKQLRKTEYIKNCCPGLFGKIKYAFAFHRLYRLSEPLGFFIYPNSFGPGLSIAHSGPILIHPSVKIGANCRIHPSTSITGAGSDGKMPRLGDCIYIAPGVRIFGSIEIADNIAIGANSVVNKSFLEPGITIAGVPANKISSKGSFGMLISGSEIAKQALPKS